MDAVRRSAQLSVAVQAVTGVVSLVGISFAPTSDLQVIVVLETVSQFIELAWYTYVLCMAVHIRSWMRYLDWILSTPLMLFSLAFFFEHRRVFVARGGISDPSAVFRAPGILGVFVFNNVMLFFGWALERTILCLPSRRQLLAGGFVAFVGSFASLFTYVDANDAVSNAVFWSTAVVWSLYGVAAALPYVEQQVTYNLVDIVSKNGYGIFVTVYASLHVPVGAPAAESTL